MCKKCGIPQKTKKRQGIHLHPMFLAVVQKLGSFSIFSDTSYICDSYSHVFYLYVDTRW
jgi:hypothetical protein